MKKWRIFCILFFLLALSACASPERAEIPMVVRYEDDGVALPEAVDPEQTSALLDRIAEPGLYEQIFYGRVLARWMTREGSAPARGVNYYHYHHDETGALYRACSEPEAQRSPRRSWWITAFRTQKLSSR